MKYFDRRDFSCWPKATICAFAVCFGVSFNSASSASEAKHVSIYSTVASYSVPVVERNGRNYVGLLEILDPLGAVKARASSEHYQIEYNDVASEFTPAKTRVRIRGKELDLAAPFLLEHNRGLVPLSSLPLLLPAILGGPVTFHEASQRLFIGSVGVRFAAQINKTIPPSIVMNFSSPVNPVIATELGKLRMTFKREPLLADNSQNLIFDNKIISSAVYQEQNGAAEITVNGSVPLFATFSNDGRTITIAPAPRLAAAPPPPNSPLPLNPAPTPPFSVMSAGTKRYFAVVDAAHGGDDRGAILNPQFAEKDVTLAFARRLRQELESRGMPAFLLRDDDGNPSQDRRASVANALHPAIYICLHATAQGTGVGLYSALLPSGKDNRGPFVPWNRAQFSYLAASQSAIKTLASEFAANHIAGRSFAASLKPLNSITGPAIAIELAPPQDGVSGLNSVEYQQLITALIAMGLSEAHLEAGR
jgi:N-acetylmuramoyl-L-alanine amidase